MRRAGEKKELTYEDIITGKTSNIRSEIVDYHKLLVEKIVSGNEFFVERKIDSWKEFFEGFL